MKKSSRWATASRAATAYLTLVWLHAGALCDASTHLLLRALNGWLLVPATICPDGIRSNSSQVYDTQRQLERESQLLKAELAAFKQQLSSWSSTTQQLLEGLKHAGDLEHYVAVLSREAAAVAKVLTAAAAAESQAEATAAAAAAVQPAEDSSTALSGVISDTAAGSGQESTAQATAAAVPAAAAAGTEQAAGALHDTADTQLQAPPELPVSKRASR
jgi:uncharacterized membrane-anchored protein YhcB (DUF1043 family)